MSNRLKSIAHRISAEGDEQVSVRDPFYTGNPKPRDLGVPEDRIYRPDNIPGSDRESLFKTLQDSGEIREEWSDGYYADTVKDMCEWLTKQIDSIRPTLDLVSNDIHDELKEISRKSEDATHIGPAPKAPKKLSLESIEGDLKRAFDRTFRFYQTYFVPQFQRKSIAINGMSPVITNILSEAPLKELFDQAKEMDRRGNRSGALNLILDYVSSIKKLGDVTPGNIGKVETGPEWFNKLIKWWKSKTSSPSASKALPPTIKRVR